MKLAILHTPLTMTFSFFLPPAQARTTVTAANTKRGERITIIDATFAEEQLRSGSFTGSLSIPIPCIPPFNHLLSSALSPLYLFLSAVLILLVALNKSGEVCWLNKSGGLSMEAGEVLDCMRIAFEKVTEWTKYIEIEVRKNEERRNLEKRVGESTAENERYEVPVQQV